MADLVGKVVLITGASRGIGAVTVQTLFAAGADVYLAAHESAADTAASCRARRPGGRAEWGVFDFLQIAAAETMVQAAHAAFGRIDILVNNAAIRIRQPFGAFTHDEFDR